MSKLIGMYQCWSASAFSPAAPYEYHLTRQAAAWDYFQTPFIVEIPDEYEPHESADGIIRLYRGNNCVITMSGSRYSDTLTLYDGEYNPQATLIRTPTDADKHLFVLGDYE